MATDELENAYNEGKEQTNFGGFYTANFKVMMATLINDPSKAFPIKRSDRDTSADNSSFTPKIVDDKSKKSPSMKKTLDDDDDSKTSLEPIKKVLRVSDSPVDHMKTVKKGKGVIDTGFIKKNSDVNK